VALSNHSTLQKLQSCCGERMEKSSIEQVSLIEMNASEPLMK
jgi:hypothetical protein